MTPHHFFGIMKHEESDFDFGDGFVVEWECLCTQSSIYLAEFTQWLSDNGYSEYAVGPKPDWSKCSGDKTASFDYIPLFCYGKDGKLLSENERKIIDKE